MHKLTVLYPSSNDPKRFREYYETVHIPLTRKMPGLLRLNYSFGLAAQGEASAPFCMFEAWFESGEAMEQATISDAGQAVLADVARFADGPPTVFHGPVIEE
jgi:uncharacterized protein (TIGR02118 family)